MLYRMFAAVVFIVSIALVAQSAQAQVGYGNYPNHVFSQYTTGGNGGLTAGQYNAPHPVPAYVGNQNTTYEPLMPHQMMYTHQRNYYNYYNDSSFYGGGPSLNVTSVRWQNGHSSFRPLPASNYLLSKLQYGLAQKAYCLGGDCDAGGIGNRRQRAYVDGGEVISEGEVFEGCSSCAGN